MQSITTAMMVRRALELFHLELKDATPRPIDDYSRSPMWLGNGYFQMDDNRPYLLSICHPHGGLGVFFYFFTGPETWCHMQVFAGDDKQWDDLSLDNRWQLWRQLNRFYSHEQIRYPPQLAEYLTNRLASYGLLKISLGGRSKRNVSHCIERGLRQTCSVYNER